MTNKCEYSGTVQDTAGLVLLAGSGNMAEVNEKNGLTVSKWKCPCGKSIDVKPVAGSTGMVRWHDAKTTSGTGRKAGTQPGTGAIATLAVFLANVAGLFMAGDIAKAQADAVEYCKRLTSSIADKRAVIHLLQERLDANLKDAETVKAGLLRGAAMIPDDAGRLAFGVALAEAFQIPIPEPKPETIQE